MIGGRCFGSVPCAAATFVSCFWAMAPLKGQNDLKICSLRLLQMLYFSALFCLQIIRNEIWNDRPSVSNTALINAKFVELVKQWTEPSALRDCLLTVIRFCCHAAFELRLGCILPSVFQVKCTMLLWPIRWPLRRPAVSVRRRMLSWPPLASSMLPGDTVWTDVTMAGSPTAAHGILLQYPECSVGEACSASGPCTATETRLASQNQRRSLELTVSKVNSLTGSGRRWLKAQAILRQNQAWTERRYDLISYSPVLPHPLISCSFAPLYTFPHLNQTNIWKSLQHVSSFVHCFVPCVSVFCFTIV